MAGRGRRSLAACTLCTLLLSLCAPRVAAQSQGAAIQKIHIQLQTQGWGTIDPQRDVCQYPSYVLPGVVCEGSVVTEL